MVIFIGTAKECIVFGDCFGENFEHFITLASLPFEDTANQLINLFAVDAYTETGVYLVF